MKILQAIIIAFVVSFSFTFNVEAEIYKWVDENGNIHFSDKPVEGQKAEKHVPEEINTFESKQIEPQKRTNVPISRKSESKQQSKKSFYNPNDKTLYITDKKYYDKRTSKEEKEELERKYLKELIEANKNRKETPQEKGKRKRQERRRKDRLKKRYQYY